MPEANTTTTTREPSKFAKLRTEMREIAAKRKGPHWGEVFTLLYDAFEEMHAELAALGVEGYQADQETEKAQAAPAAGQ